MKNKKQNTVLSSEQQDAGSWGESAGVRILGELHNLGISQCLAGLLPIYPLTPERTSWFPTTEKCSTLQNRKKIEYNFCSGLGSLKE